MMVGEGSAGWVNFSCGGERALMDEVSGQVWGSLQQALRTILRPFQIRGLDYLGYRIPSGLRWSRALAALIVQGPFPVSSPRRTPHE